MPEWINCGECEGQTDLFESHPIDAENYPVDEDMRMCLECYESFYWFYDQTRE